MFTTSIKIGDTSLLSSPKRTLMSIQIEGRGQASAAGKSRRSGIDLASLAGIAAVLGINSNLLSEIPNGKINTFQPVSF
jgi:hypothetical protein